MKTMFKFRNLLTAVAGLMVTSGMVSCSKDDPAPTVRNIVQLAQTDTTLSILVSAVSKAGLATTLSTTSNLTVFAPTNAAFRAAGYPQTVIDALTPAQVTSILTPILTYHVVGATVSSSAVPASDTVKTLNGKNIYASRNANGVFVNGIAVTAADLTASNGVVHKIGGVLVPPTKTIAQIVIDDPANFSLLLTAVSKAGLADALLGPGKFTVFAPTNAAFGATPFNTADAINAADATAVGNIVKAHVIGTSVFASDLINGATAPTLNAGQTLTISLPAAVKITGSANPASAVSAANIVATNGVVHVIDRVIL
ncbi:MAG TPA: fasciclin domain-containing protein [Ferruginibacter sp.]|nr:fasciclin domain-containing protein [Ferruginibacter sp.]HMP19980.1 fasciclin domain-containing protein [Ferruginibacter sp.]